MYENTCSGKSAMMPKEMPTKIKKTSISKEKENEEDNEKAGEIRLVLTPAANGILRCALDRG